MKSDLIIRRAEPGDAETIAAFQQAMARETEARALDAGTLLAGVRAALLDPRHGVYYLAEHGGTVVGGLLVTYEWSDWRNGQFWWIQSVYVVPEARRAGVYTALHRHAEQLARRTPGVCGLRLYVDNHNQRAQAVYRRLGMKASNYTLYETDWVLDSHASRARSPQT